MQRRTFLKGSLAGSAV
ncbi:MAG: twin-arginine translocation signal domain-containing protein, partial [Gammaproteobacteria bacterium]